ncbi:MAG: hypothetical protein RLZZ548_238, partial [Bacteroidota bacterium]
MKMISIFLRNKPLIASALLWVAGASLNHLVAQTKQPAAKQSTTVKPGGAGKPGTPANGPVGKGANSDNRIPKSAVTGTPGDTALV